MNKMYKSHKLKDRLKKGIFAASLAGAALLSGGLAAQTTPTYCASAPYYTNDDEIFNVTFSNINNTSACGTTAPGSGSQSQLYSNFTAPAVAAATVVTGVNYSLSVTVGQCNGNPYAGYVAVWIDYNQNGSFTDPGEQVFLSSNTNWAVAGTAINSYTGATIPSTATAGMTRMRVIACESNTPSSPCGNNWGYYYGETEDYSVYIIQAPACTGTPPTGSISVPSGSVCTGTQLFLSQSPSGTLSGVSYTWQACTTGSVGTYTNIPGGTSPYFLTNASSTTTWYRLVATCQNGGSPATSVPSEVMVVATVTSSVPYYEGFEEPQIQQDQAPNCSWSASNMAMSQYGNTADYNSISPYNGNGMGIMGEPNNYNYTPLTNYYTWTNGIQLNAGVTYSASMFYAGFDYAVTLSYGTTQTSSGLTPIVSVAINSTSWKNMSDTFRVATSGLYYIAITAATQYVDEPFAFDDLSITAPCIYPNNAANTVLTGTTSVCLGSSVVLTASGANSYTWQPGGATSNTIAVTPNNATAYSVSGTKNLSNCVLTQTTFVNVEPVPGVQILPSVSAICAGQTATLIAIGSGATSFTWSTGDSGPSAYTTTISPSQTTTYNLVGINSYGCTTTATQQITVNQPPSLTITGNTNICVGEPGTLLANGANTYTWSSPSSYLQTNPISPYPTIIGTTSYTINGIDANGCSGSTTVDLTVNVCTGIQTNAAGITNLQVYPNPTSGVFTVELNNGLSKTIEVMDVTGRVILNSSTENDKMDVNINNLSNGIYYVRVKSDNATEVLKIVKQ